MVKIHLTTSIPDDWVIVTAIFHSGKFAGELGYWEITYLKVEEE